MFLEAATFNKLDNSVQLFANEGQDILFSKIGDKVLSEEFKPESYPTGREIYFL